MFSSAGCFQWKNSLIVICESIFDSAEVVLFLYYALVLGGDVLFLAKPLMMKNPFLISIFRCPLYGWSSWCAGTHILVLPHWHSGKEGSICRVPKSPFLLLVTGNSRVVPCRESIIEKWWLEISLPPHPYFSIYTQGSSIHMWIWEVRSELGPWTLWDLGVNRR